METVDPQPVVQQVIQAPDISTLRDSYSGSVQAPLSGTYNTDVYRSPLFVDEMLMKFQLENHHWIESFLTFS